MKSFNATGKAKFTASKCDSIQGIIKKKLADWKHKFRAASWARFFNIISRLPLIKTELIALMNDRINKAINK